MGRAPGSPGSANPTRRPEEVSRASARASAGDAPARSSKGPPPTKTIDAQKTLSTGASTPGDVEGEERQPRPGARRRRRRRSHRAERSRRAGPPARGGRARRPRGRAAPRRTAPRAGTPRPDPGPDSAAGGRPPSGAGRRPRRRAQAAYPRSSEDYEHDAGRGETHPRAEGRQHGWSHDRERRADLRFGAREDEPAADLRAPGRAAFGVPGSRVAPLQAGQAWHRWTCPPALSAQRCCAPPQAGQRDCRRLIGGGLLRRKRRPPAERVFWRACCARARRWYGRGSCRMR